MCQRGKNNKGSVRPSHICHVPPRNYQSVLFDRTRDFNLVLLGIGCRFLGIGSLCWCNFLLWVSFLRDGIILVIRSWYLLLFLALLHVVEVDLLFWSLLDSSFPVSCVSNFLAWSPLILKELLFMYFHTIVLFGSEKPHIVYVLLFVWFSEFFLECLLDNFLFFGWIWGLPFVVSCTWNWITMIIGMLFPWPYFSIYLPIISISNCPYLFLNFWEEFGRTSLCQGFVRQSWSWSYLGGSSSNWNDYYWGPWW